MDEDEAGAPPSMTLVEGLSRLKAVIGVSLCDEGLFFFAVATTHAPYLRSLVRCGGRRGGGDDGAFSGSAHCGDRDVVLKRGASLSGTAMSLVVLGNVFSMLLWAPFIDRVGRKYVAVRSLVGLCLGFVVLAAATRAAPASEAAAVAITFVAYFLLALTSGTTPATAAMAADLAPRDEKSQRAAMACTWCGWGVGTVAAYLAGFFVLRLELEDYAPVYAACAGLAAAAAGLAAGALDETLAKAESAPRPSPTRGLVVVARSRRLRRVVAAFSLASCGILLALSIVTTWGISALGYSQATLALAVFLQQVGVFLGCAAGGVFAGATEPIVAGAYVLVAACLALAGGAAPLWRPALWPALFGVGLGAGLATTASAAVLGSAVPGADQGQAQAACIVIGYVGGALGSLVGPRLYAPAATRGLRAGAPFFAGAAVVLAGAAVLALAPSPTAAGDDDDGGLARPLVGEGEGAP